MSTSSLSAAVVATVIPSLFHPPPLAPARRQRAASKQWPCSHCSESFAGSSQSNLLRHIRTAHRELSTVRSCMVCDHDFPNERELMQHVQAKPCKAVPPTFQPTPLSVAPTAQQIAEGFADFYAYLQETPQTTSEKTIRKGALSEEAMVRPKRNVSVLVQVIHQLFPGVFDAGVRPSILVHSTVATPLLTHLRTEREGKRGRKGLGADRMGELTLEMKRIVSYIASRQHRNSGVSLTFDRQETWGLVSLTSTEASRGIVLKRSNRDLLPHSDPSYISQGEMMQVIVRCEDVMGKAMAASLDSKWSSSVCVKRDFVAHFITAIIAMCIAPRSQCLAWMTELDVVETGLTAHPMLRTLFHPGHSLNPYPNYLIAIPAQRQKKRKAWTMV